MKTYYLGQYEKSMPNDFSLKDKLALSKTSGFDYMELSVDETDEKLKRLYMPKQELSEWKRIIDGEGQPIRSICLSAHRKYPLGSLDNERVKKSLEISERAVCFAAEIGARSVQLAGYDVYYEKSTEESGKRFWESLYKTVSYASKCGVSLGFETMETPFMNTCKKAMRYVKEVASPYLNVYPDVGNIRNAEQDVVADLKTAKGHIIAAHLKETKEGYFRDVPFGEGRTPYVQCIKELISQGVGMFVLEFWYAKGCEPHKFAKDGFNYVTEKFEEAIKEQICLKN